MRRTTTPGPVTVQVYHGSVKVAERHYKNADTAARALWGSPRWIMQPIWKLRAGRTPGGA